MRAPSTNLQSRNRDIGNVGGHRLLCWKCGTFQMHKADLETNGETAIVLRCRTCEESDRFVYRAGMWIHEKVVPMLDVWVDQIVEEATGLRFEKKEDGWHVTLGKEPESKPVEEKRFGRKQKTEPSADRGTPKAVAQDEFKAIDLSRIRTFKDASALFPDNFDKARRLLEMAGRMRSK